MTALIVSIILPSPRHLTCNFSDSSQHLRRQPKPLNKYVKYAFRRILEINYYLIDRMGYDKLILLRI
jgi:hypothetical protein